VTFFLSPRYPRHVPYSFVVDPPVDGGAAGPGPQEGKPHKRSAWGALKAGWALAGSSWSVLSAVPSLLLASFVAVVLGALSVGLDILAWGGVEEAFGGNAFIIAGRSLPLLFVGHSLAVVSEAVIVGAARGRLAGGEPGLGEGWRLATRRLHTLVAYGFLRALERALTLLLSVFREPGRWVANLIDAAWDFATFLAIPVILFERPQSAVRAVRRSAHLVRSRWGVQLAAQTTIGLAAFVVLAPLVGIAALLGWLAFGSTGAWTAVIAGLLILDVVTSALSAVLSAALFRYIHAGETSPGFDEGLLASVYRPRK